MVDDLDTTGKPNYIFDFRRKSVEISLEIFKQWVDRLEESSVKEDMKEIVNNYETSMYDPNFGNDRICKCGHTYDRHFDPYENWAPVGCKYCECWSFEEKIEENK